MENDISIKLLQQMINRVYDIISIEPSAKIVEKVPEARNQNSRFNKENSTVHLCIPGIPLYADDFKDMFTIGNPNGLKFKTAMFSALVDAIPSTGDNKYIQTAKRVSLAFKAVVEAANSHGKMPDDNIKELLNKYNKVLFNETGKTVDYERYEKLIEEMDSETEKLIKAANGASELADWQGKYISDEIEKMSDNQKDQLKNQALKRSEKYWEENSFKPRKNYQKIKKEFDADAKMKYVKQALDFQVAHGNEFTSSLLANCKNLASKGNYDIQDLDISVKLSFPSSIQFIDHDDGYIKIECNTTNYQKDEKSFKINANLGLKGIIKLITFGLNGGVTVQKDSLDTQFESISTEFEVCLVNIIRPWMDATLFSNFIKWDAGIDQQKGSVSSGKRSQQTDDHLIPFIPMQMIVAKNVKLEANWNKDHQEMVKQAVKAGLSIGWGPFKIAPSVDESTTHFKQNTQTGKSYLDIPGMQCIGFISWIPPFSATEDGNSQSKSQELDKKLIKGQDLYEENANKLVTQYSLPPKLRAGQL